MSKFFSYEERLEIQRFLKQGLSFKEISRRLSKNPSTFSREVRKYFFKHLQDIKLRPVDIFVEIIVLEVLYTVSIVIYIIKTTQTN